MVKLGDKIENIIMEKQNSADNTLFWQQIKNDRYFNV